MNVALFGKTQVGKTTLILKLMEIKDECFDIISTLLRCGSEIGYSATPTAMIYCYSDDQEFKIALHSTENSSPEMPMSLDFKGIDGMLKHIRQKIESNQFSDLNAIKIGIPKLYFNEGDHIDINIIDLPGLNSTNVHEKSWTKTLIKQFLPAANIVLVLDRGNQVAGFLDLFEDDELNRITNWKYFPEKYRVITTYSYSAESVLKMFEHSSDVSSEGILNHYRQEIKRSLSSDECENLIVYPLEYGDSWIKFCNDNAENKSLGNVKEVNHQFFNILKQDIKESATELNQISMLLKLRIAFKLRIKEFEKELKAVDAKYEQDKLQLDTQLNEIKQIIEELRERVTLIHQSYEDLKKPRIETAGFYYYEINGNDSYERNKLLSRIEDIKRYSREHVDNFEREIKMITDILKIKNVVDDEIDTVIHDNVEIIQKTLGDNVAELFAEVKNELKYIKHNKRDSILCGLIRWGPQQYHVDMLDKATTLLNQYLRDELHNEVVMPHIGQIYDYLGRVCNRYETRLSKSEQTRIDLERSKQNRFDDHNRLVSEIRGNIDILDADAEKAARVSDSIKTANDHYLDIYNRGLLESSGSNILLNLLKYAQVRKDYSASLKTAEK
ncbi:MAG TPA: hypothetical protein PLQ79_02890 [Candidatus Cloacimonadota bacterium]|nr:hypothetical protein [Candidatus Cloacimonadota bacterium]